MSRSMGLGSVGRRTQVITNGAQMANATIEVYQEHRAVKRSRDSLHFPGDINSETMRVDENDLLFTFIREDDRVATRDTYEYGSHVGMPVFSCLNGIDMDRYEFLKSAKLVGVAKSHTTNDDTGPSGITEFAAYIAGTFTIINNGTKLIPMQTEIMVMIYDKVHNEDMFKKLFEEYSHSGYRGGEDLRVLGVVEPYEKSESIIDTIRRFGKTGDFIVEADENLRAVEIDGTMRKFGIAEKVETMEDGLADLLVMGGFFFTLFLRQLTAGGGPRALANDDFINYAKTQLRNMTDNRAPQDVLLMNALDDFSAVIHGENDADEDLTESLYRTITMKNSAEKLADKGRESGPGFSASFHGRISKSQRGLRKLYSGLKGLVMWEREWIIGKSTKTAAPGEALDLIIRR